MTKNLLKLISAMGLVSALGLLSGMAFNAVAAQSLDNNADRCLEESKPSNQLSLAAIGGYIWGCKFDDVNGNGNWDVTENPIAGWGIELVDEATDTVVGTATTDGDGYYDFDNVEPGDYVVREIQQTGWTQTAPNSDTCSIEMIPEEGAEPRENPDQLWMEGNCIFGNKVGEEPSPSVTPTPTDEPTPSVTPSPTPDDGNNGGSGSQSRSGSGTQSSDRSDRSNPTPEREPEVQGAATETPTVTPSETEAVLATTGISLIGIAVLGLINLQLGLVSSARLRQSVLNLISKIA